ncbi:MAG: hypothetical protein V4792_00430 [Pseudomonadota bacterium]
MQQKQIEKWVWKLIYGGMLGFSLGWFLLPSADVAAWALMSAGVVAAVVGVALIFVRARMGP